MLIHTFSSSEQITELLECSMRRRGAQESVGGGRRRAGRRVNHKELKEHKEKTKSKGQESRSSASRLGRFIEGGKSQRSAQSASPKGGGFGCTKDHPLKRFH